MEFIGYAVMALLIMSMFLSLTCIVGAKGPLPTRRRQIVLFLCNVDNSDANTQVSTYSTIFYLASPLDIVVTAPSGLSPATGIRDTHYHYHYNDRRRVYYQNTNSKNSQSTMCSNCYNDHIARV